MCLDTRHERLGLLADAIRAVETRGVGASAQPRGGVVASVGRAWSSDPADLLMPGRVHEWIAADESAARGDWQPPLCVLAHAARRVMRTSRERGETRHAVWIGRRCWPFAPMLGGAISHCVFIDPPDAGTRLWALDAALRCPGVCVVVADGSGLDMAASRRLQLAAETGGVTGLLARPARERSALSAASTRWLVTPAPTFHSRPRWIVDLLRCKGLRPTPEAPRRFVVEWDHAQGALVVPAELGHRTGEPPGEAAPLPARAAG